MTAPNEAEPRTSRDRYVVARLGDPDGLLLAGPRAEEGAEVARGVRGPDGDSAVVVRRRDLPRAPRQRSPRARGRQFPALAQASGGNRVSRRTPTGCQLQRERAGQPKGLDNLLLPTPYRGRGCSGHRPGAWGHRRVVIHLHGVVARDPRAALRNALIERGSPEGDPVWRISCGPGGYVAGEASAVARHLHAGVSFPLFTSGPTGSPWAERPADGGVER